MVFFMLCGCNVSGTQEELTGEVEQPVQVRHEDMIFLVIPNAQDYVRQEEQQAAQTQQEASRGSGGGDGRRETFGRRHGHQANIDGKPGLIFRGIPPAYPLEGQGQSQQACQHCQAAPVKRGQEEQGHQIAHMAQAEKQDAAGEFTGATADVLQEIITSGTQHHTQIRRQQYRGIPTQQRHQQTQGQREGQGDLQGGGSPEVIAVFLADIEQEAQGKGEQDELSDSLLFGGSGGCLELGKNSIS